MWEGEKVPVLFEEFLVLLVLELVQLVQILILESVLVRLLLRLDQGLLDDGFRVRRLLGDYAFLAEDVVPER